MTWAWRGPLVLVTVNAILDQLLHHSLVITIRADCYLLRMKHEHRNSTD